MLFAMLRVTTVLCAGTFLLTACGDPAVPLPVRSTNTSTAEEGFASSRHAAVATTDFPSAIAVAPDVLTSLLASTFVVADPTVRALLARAREPFRLTLADGVHPFPPRLKSMGLTRAAIRRDLVTTGDVQGNEAADIVAMIEYSDDGGVLASEVLVFAVDGLAVKHTASFVLGEVSVERIGIANRAIRVRGVCTTGKVDMTLTQDS